MPNHSKRPNVNRRGKSARRRHFMAAIGVLGLVMLGHRYQQALVVHPKHAAGDRAGKDAAETNYAREVRRAADKYDLEYSYLMSLLMLECGGRKPSGVRFEPHVFKRLKQVRDGKRAQYEHVTPRHLADASDEALKNLATSWGPFQLMGYKCILLGVKIQDIRGADGVDHGADWINRTYGAAMRQGRFRDCFHMHNAGTPYPASGLPQTHDPQYVPRGMAMMDQFSTRTTSNP